MATAHTYTHVPVPPPTETRVILDMSMAEADVLLRVLGKVGGPPAGRRGLLDNIRKSMVGCMGDVCWGDNGYEGMTGNIMVDMEV